MVVSERISAGLSASQRDAFDRDGYLVLPDVLESDPVARLTEAVDRVWAAHRREPAGPGAAPLHLLAFVGEDRAFLELLDHPVTLPMVVDVLGWNVFMHHCHLDVHPPEPLEDDGVWRWHQDGGPQNLDLETDPRPRMSVKLAYFLSDCSEPGRGNFRVIPGSHLRNTLPRPGEGGTPDPPGAEPVLARAGDAVLFDRRLWHMRCRNRSAITRKALFYSYTYRWVRARDDLEVRGDLRGLLTPVRAQLLGAGSSAIGHWMPADEDVPLRVR